MRYFLRPQILFAIFAGFFFIRTILMPLAYDDYAYAFIWDGEHDGNLQMMMIGSPEVETRERVDSFGDIFDSMWSHYFTWGGRIFAHSIVQFFMWIGKPAFDVANTIVFIALVLSIIKLAAAQIKFSRNVLLWIFFSLFILSAWSMTTMFWLTGSCNYMWMSLVQMLFLIPYVNALRSNVAPLNFWLMIPLGFLAGWSNEAGALATICLTIFLMKLCKARKVYRPQMTAGFITLIIGCAFMMFSPGNLVRMEFSHPNFHYSLEVFLEHLTTEFPRVVGANLIALLPVWIYFLRRNFFGRLNTTEILMAAFTAASFLVPVIMLFSPEFTLRVSITSMIFALVAASTAILELERRPIKILSEKILRGISAGLIAVFIAYFLTLIYMDVQFFKATCQTEEFLQNNKEVELISLKPVPISHRFDAIHGDRVTRYYMAHFGGIDTNPKDCRNVITSQYYGIKGIVAVND